MILCLGTTPTLARSMRFARVEMNGVNRTADVFNYAAGKAVNAARVIHALGLHVSCLGFCGGFRAAEMVRLMKLDGIRPDFVEVDAPARLCITLIDESNRTATELVEESHPVRTEDGERLLGVLERRLGEAKVLVLSGSLVGGVSSDFYARCIELARRAKVKTVLDANGDALRLGIDARPDFVKINANEFREAFSISKSSALDEPIANLAREKQIRLIVTDGAKSVLASDGAKLYSVTPPTIDVVSPIGSGDSFAGGLVVGIRRGESFEQALVLGVACAADNARSPHAGFVDANRVRELVGRLRLSSEKSNGN